MKNSAAALSGADRKKLPETVPQTDRRGNKQHDKGRRADILRERNNSAALQHEARNEKCGGCHRQKNINWPWHTISFL